MGHITRLYKTHLNRNNFYIKQILNETKCSRESTNLYAVAKFRQQKLKFNEKAVAVKGHICPSLFD